MYFLLFLFFIYILFISIYIYATIKLPYQKLDFFEAPGLSIIVAIRNGEDSLQNLINSLINQDYPGSLEFILVDDDSDDKTKDIIMYNMNLDKRFRYFSSLEGDKNLSNKKKALDIGIQNAQYNYLLFTDVDCIIPQTWISTMSRYFQAGYEYIVGTSIVQRKTKMNFISIFQRIDFLLLMIICRASTFFGYPLASSGQNQGFTKSLYDRVGGFNNINSFIGDDTAFLQYCSSLGCKSTFVDNSLSCIYSRQESKLSNFIHQRIRWVSDANKLWKINVNFFLILISSFIFFVSLPILFSISSYMFILQLIVIKSICEFTLLFIGSRKLNTSIGLYDFLVWEIFHIPYIIVVGTLSYFTRSLTWKGRKIN